MHPPNSLSFIYIGTNTPSPLPYHTHTLIHPSMSPKCTPCQLHHSLSPPLPHIPLTLSSFPHHHAFFALTVVFKIFSLILGTLSHSLYLLSLSFILKPLSSPILVLHHFYSRLSVSSITHITFCIFISFSISLFLPCSNCCLRFPSFFLSSHRPSPSLAPLPCIFFIPSLVYRFYQKCCLPFFFIVPFFVWAFSVTFLSLSTAPSLTYRKVLYSSSFPSSFFPPFFIVCVLMVYHSHYLIAGQRLFKTSPLHR